MSKQKIKKKEKEIYKYLEILNVSLNCPLVKEEITRKIITYFEINKSETTTYHSL